MELSIIIVNYQSPQLIIGCLQTIFSETTEIAFEIIIVDNNSQDDSRSLIVASFPKVRWVQMEYNAGFARANNAGIKLSTAEIILLLNPDTLIVDQAIEKCYQHFVVSKYAACGVQLLNADKTPQISGNYFMTGGLNYLLPLPYLGGLLRSVAKFIKVKEPNVPEAKGITEVDWINGAYLMVKKNIIQKAGGLDEDFFLYAEEAEWCSRIKKEGKLCIYGDIKIIHFQGETANQTYASSGKGYMNMFDKKGLQIMLSNLVRIRKQFGIFWFLVILLFFILEIPVFFTGVVISKIIFVKKYSFKEVKNYAANVFKIVMLSHTIIKNRPYFYKVL